MKYCHELLEQLLDCPAPDNVIVPLKSMAGRSILAIGFGLEVQARNDPILEIAETWNAALGDVFTLPVTFLLDTFPLLQYLPSWMPGGGFQAKLPEWVKASSEMFSVPFATAHMAIKAKTASPSVVSYTLEQEDYTQDAEERIKSAAATMHGAGADTTVSVIGVFILNMLCHPEIQERAHNELDTKLNLKAGPRLPTMDDEESLPYISAIVKECLRWMPVAPLGVPHYTDVEDIYAGYHVPPKTIVLTNMWAMVHDEDIYPDSFTFNPDRFMKDGQLNPDILNPGNIVFGFGRRVCPGRWLALSSIWMTIVSILTLFEIRKAVDDEGNVIEPSFQYESKFTVLPEPFTCHFVPRFNNAKDLLSQGGC